MKTWGRFSFLLFIWSTLTQPIKKIQWYIPFPAGSGFRQSEAPERRSPSKFKVVPHHMCTIVLLVVNGQDPTAGFDQTHRHQFLPSELMELELETTLSQQWNMGFP